MIILLSLLSLLTGCSAIQGNMMTDITKIQFGIASWYGKDFHARKTTSGEKYDMNELTAAHRSLPFGTLVQVTNIKNGRSVTVRINDRGPRNPRRVIDLSYAAAEKLGMLNDGIARVRLDIGVDNINEPTLMASWYGQKLQGHLTANGEICDINQLTAAHRLLPFDSLVRVTNPENGKSVLVRINDRMPRSQGEMINLSKRAAENLDILKDGITKVTLEVVKLPPSH